MTRPPALDQAVWRSCNNGDCVEVAVLEGTVWVRGSRGDGAVLPFTFDEWSAFVSGAKRGLFDLERLAPEL
ncbi:DUF397 domain-containing protein [Nonomuraea sp. NPDC002799]